MASSADSWMREFNEASKLADEVGSMISAKSSLLSSGPETQRHLSAARRKITILKTRLDTLQSLLPTLPSKQPLTKKEMKRRHDMLDNLVTKANQMATTLNMNHLANRDSLLGPETKRPDVISRATGLDNQEQDEDLDKLEETVTSTKHVALAINEELNLHTALLDNLDYHVDTTNSRLLIIHDDKLSSNSSIVHHWRQEKPDVAFLLQILQSTSKVLAIQGPRICPAFVMKAYTGCTVSAI
ncbi:Syntaxin-51 [Capsicum baccatum]|uniref:Syntaxin-51 n=1 Tax=Capsicum baccatum TaxID=33114 RepID=A0A2G2VVK2_CAPBA|nr:Syntaxin-51 [Capsicum baccatum]